MAIYNFDDIIERHGTNSYKWDSTPNADVLPLWVADMDFRTAPPIIEALEQRVAHGIFGYTGSVRKLGCIHSPVSRIMRTIWIV